MIPPAWKLWISIFILILRKIGEEGKGDQENWGSKTENSGIERKAERKSKSFAERAEENSRNEIGRRVQSKRTSARSKGAAQRAQEGKGIYRMQNLSQNQFVFSPFLKA